MPERAQILRVVVASPGDVQAERDLVPRVIADLNKGIAKDRGLRLEVFRWEDHSYPGLDPEGPQGIIDRTLGFEDADIVIGIFWKRFGTLTPEGTTGTEHEIRRSCEAWKERNRPQVMLYFNQEPSTPQSSEELFQWGHVLKFQEEFSKKEQGLWWRYKGWGEFESLLRDHLTSFIRDQYRISTPGVEGRRVTGDPWDSGGDATISALLDRQAACNLQQLRTPEASGLQPSVACRQDRPAARRSRLRSAHETPLYQACAFALSGELKQPYAEAIRKQAFVKLMDDGGGMFSQRSDKFRLEGAASFSSAYTQVAGSTNSEVRNVLASASVEKLNLLDVVTADRVVARISIDVPIGRNEPPKVSLVGTTFENLRIGGASVEAHLQTGVFVYDQANLQRGEPRRGTLVTAIGSRHPSSLNTITLPGLGTLVLGELLVDRDSFQLEMIRFAASSGYVGKITIAACQASTGP